MDNIIYDGTYVGFLTSIYLHSNASFNAKEAFLLFLFDFFSISISNSFLIGEIKINSKFLLTSVFNSLIISSLSDECIEKIRGKIYIDNWNLCWKNNDIKIMPMISYFPCSIRLKLEYQENSADNK